MVRFRCPGNLKRAEPSCHRVRAPASVPLPHGFDRSPLPCDQCRGDRLQIKTLQNLLSSKGLAQRSYTFIVVEKSI